MFILAMTGLQGSGDDLPLPSAWLQAHPGRYDRRAPERYQHSRNAWTCSPDAAALLARMADGGMRDALTLLDQCSGSDVITTEAVISAMGLAGNLRTARLLQSIAGGDTAKTLEQFRSLWQDGKDPAALLDGLKYAPARPAHAGRGAARRPRAALRWI